MVLRRNDICESIGYRNDWGEAFWMADPFRFIHWDDTALLLSYGSVSASYLFIAITIATLLGKDNLALSEGFLYEF